MVPGGNKNALNREVGKDGLRDWSTNLCCCSCDGSGFRICMSTSPQNLFCMRADPLPWKAVWRRGVLVWSSVETNNASAIYRVKAPLSRAGVPTLMVIVPFTAA